MSAARESGQELATAETAGAQAPLDPVRAERNGPQRLSSVATAVRLLNTFSEGEAEIGVTTLSKRLGVGMLEQNRENDKYRLGLALFGLGALVRQRMNVSTEARPHIFALREATNETVHLAVPEGAQIIYVYDLESTQAIRQRANLGERKPAFCSAEGRASRARTLIPAILSARLSKCARKGMRWRMSKARWACARWRRRFAILKVASSRPWASPARCSA
jgi:hypothetical protein